MSTSPLFSAPSTPAPQLSNVSMHARSPSPDHQTSDDDIGDTSDKETKLWVCLHRELDSPKIASFAVFKGLLASGPRKLSTMSDALYWADKDDISRPAILKFVGLLDLYGANGRTRPYFSLDGLRVIDPRNFKKAKAQFEIRSLPLDCEEYPINARKQSQLFFSGLTMLTDKFEAKRNQNLAKNQIPNVTKIVKINTDEDRFTVVVQTEPLFAELNVDGGNSEDVAPVELDDLESEASFGLLSSPSKMLARRKAKIDSGAEAPVTSLNKTLDDMPDPNGIYSKFVGRHPQFSHCEVIPPPVYDSNQDIIHPAEYSTRLVHLAPVSVEANVRLWEIAPETSGRMGGRQNGSRAYQLIIKSLQVLPYIPKKLPGLLQVAKGKGKRKATADGLDNAGPSTPRKRSRKNDINDRDIDMSN